MISERPYELAWPEGGSAWIQDFELEHRERLRVDIARVEANFREAFSAAWTGAIENEDGCDFRDRLRELQQPAMKACFLGADVLVALPFQDFARF